MVPADRVDPCSAPTPVNAPETCGLNGALASTTPILAASAISAAEAARGWLRRARFSASTRVSFFGCARARVPIESQTAERILISTGLFPGDGFEDGGLLHFD